MKKSLYNDKDNDFERVVFIGDVHIPYHDKGALELTLQFVLHFKPHRIFLIGDIADFYDPSSFLKDPDKVGRLQEEIDESVSFFTRIRTENPTAKILFIEGNHEERLSRYMKKNSELHSLRCLKLPYLFEFEDLNIDFLPYRDHYIYRDLWVGHGFKTSIYCAHHMIRDLGMSGITGHTHRLSSCRKTHVGKTLSWYENGHLQYTPVEYLHGEPNWQLGFTAGYACGNTTLLYSIPIMKDKQNLVRYLSFGDFIHSVRNLNI